MHKERNEFASLGILILACLPLVGMMWAACAVMQSRPGHSQPTSVASPRNGLEVTQRAGNLVDRGH
ncbi:MAG: hypothetical protein JWM99_4836 [Verrucomicrobiales bacterium]|nr:hypothetical protein [Verrucomicrobiales bacterium]